MPEQGAVGGQVLAAAWHALARSPLQELSPPRGQARLDTERGFPDPVAMLSARLVRRATHDRVLTAQVAAGVRVPAGLAPHETTGLAMVLLDVRVGPVHDVATDRYCLLRWQVRAPGRRGQGEQCTAVPVEQVPALTAWLAEPPPYSRRSAHLARQRNIADAMPGAQRVTTVGPQLRRAGWVPDRLAGSRSQLPVLGARR